MSEERDVILPFRNIVREAAQREEASDELGVARCPMCAGPLQVCVDRRGPHFVCACSQRRSA